MEYPIGVGLALLSHSPPLRAFGLRLNRAHVGRRDQVHAAGQHVKDDLGRARIEIQLDP
jgi:hypothetical protein